MRFLYGLAFLCIIWCINFLCIYKRFTLLSQPAEVEGIGKVLVQQQKNLDNDDALRQSIRILVDEQAKTTERSPQQLNSLKRPVAKNTNDESKMYTRAVFGYMFSNKGDQQKAELRWLLESWKEMQKYEPPNFRTDVVIVVESDIPDLFAELNCYKLYRTSSKEPNACRIITGYEKSQTHENILGENDYADSFRVVSFAHEQGALSVYDSLLRTDLDTFLTPAFSTWKPAKLVVGKGGFCWDNQITCKRLRKIARYMGLAPPKGVPSVDNIGSTWYGPTQTIVKCANLTLEVMEHLAQNEFTSVDKTKIRQTASNWPGWHYGVVSLYSGQIAINFCGQETGFEQQADMLDVETTSKKSIYSHAHLRDWGNDVVFSKIQFHNGEYKNMNIDTLNLTKIHDYALAMALRSRGEMAQTSAAQTQELTKQKESSFTRAVVLYFPLEKRDVYEAELSWLLESWKEMKRFEPPTWRTDVVVVVQNDSPELFDELNCTTLPRTNRKDKNTCRIITGYKANQTHEDVLSGFFAADSIRAVPFASTQGALHSYDALLRTDLDTFLTPAFSDWKPTKLVVGQGGYCSQSEITCKRLSRIAWDMGLAPPVGVPPVENVGSTWYGPTNTVVNCSNLSVKVMEYLEQNEFTDADKTIIGTDNWPGWHYGVMSMYSGHIAINFCGQEMGIEKRADMMDFPATSGESIYKHAHLHTWHTEKLFSKFVFRRGGYNNITIEELNTTKVHDYALSLALKSRMSRMKK